MHHQLGRPNYGEGKYILGLNLEAIAVIFTIYFRIKVHLDRIYKIYLS